MIIINIYIYKNFNKSFKFLSNLINFQLYNKKLLYKSKSNIEF